ncbi:ABC transporter substrate-binding protein [Pseudoruegeria sp. M32A2M]|nr:ABC transporter substrate-binding protein [Aliiruegeria sabulilitoris]NDR55588.1 ABC transporter substrate-binding protein [Pseudoruegeria sp. M32A2M]
MVIDFSRRSTLSVLLAGAAAVAMPGAALALSPDKAVRLVEALIADINKVISSGKSESAMYREFERIFTRYADVPTIARYSLGADARRASKAQLSAYTKAYTGYISRKYGKRFREFIGGRLEVQDARTVKKSIEVRTVAHLRGESPFKVDFLVRDGMSKFYNMTIDGVNMLQLERTEIGAMLDRRKGNIDALIQDLKTAS